MKRTLARCRRLRCSAARRHCRAVVEPDAHGQRLQLVRLCRADGDRGLHQGNRHQGPLRHLRCQRDAGNQAPRRQVRLRRGGADRLFPASARSRPACSRSSTSRSCRISAMSGRRSPSGSRSTIPAISTPSTTCGARPASATTSRRPASVLKIDGPIGRRDGLLGHRVQAGEPRQVQGLRRPHARFRRRHPAGGAALSRARSEHHAAGRSGKGRRSADQGPAERAQVPLVGISQRARLRRNLPGGRLVGRHQAGAEARRRSQGGKRGVEIGYAIPKGGAQMFFDNFAIPKDAKNVAEAHAFIDYMLRPEVAAKNSNFLGYANGNLASQPLLDKAVLDDRTVYPDAETMKTPLPHHRARPENAAADEPAVDQGQDRPVAASFALTSKSMRDRRSYSSRQRRCSHSHCSGCSRTQPSTTSVMTCMVRSTSILPSASRGASIASVDPQLEAVAGIAHHADAVDRAVDVAGQPRDQRIGAGAAAEERHRHAAAPCTDRPAWRRASRAAAPRRAGPARPGWSGSASPCSRSACSMTASEMAGTFGRR